MDQVDNIVRYYLGVNILPSFSQLGKSYVHKYKIGTKRLKTVYTTKIKPHACVNN